MRFTFPHFQWRLVFCLVLAACCSWASFGAAAEWRTWNSKVGTEVEAQYISQTDTHVVLKTKAGAQITVEKTKLSDNDQEFLKWLAEDTKKPAAKPEPAAKPDKNTAKPDSTAKPDKTAKPETPAAPAKQPELNPAGTSAAPDKPAPAGKRPLEKPDPQKLEIPFNTFPLANRKVATQKPTADPPQTDYAKLARELCAPVPRPKFVELHKFKLPLVHPETAMIAQAGHYLVDHNDKQEQLDVWDLQTGKLVNSIKVGPLANPRCFAISPAGSLVGIGRSDHAIVAFHAATGKTMCIVPRLAVEGKKLVRLAFNWEEDEIVTLNDVAEIDRMLLLDPTAKRHTFRNALPDEAKDYASNNDEIWLTVSGTGRIGARLTDRFTYACYVQKQDAGFKAKAHRTYLALPVRNGIIYWSRNELTRYSVSYSTTVNAEKQSSSTVQHRAIDCIDFAKYSLDRRDQYLWASNATGTETVDIYDLDCFDIPVRVATPLQKPGKQLHWHSSSTRRLYYFDPATTEMTVHELQQFEPPPTWKVITAFHRALLEKRYDLLDGLAKELDKDMRHLDGGRQLPVLTEVVHSFNRQQFLVPPDEWTHRLQTWSAERQTSTLPRLVMAQHMLLHVTSREATGNKENRLKFAEESIKNVLQDKQPYGETLYMQLRIGALQGWDKEKCLELAARMAQVAPEHTEFHREMCKLLLSEERGEDGDTELYAKTIADHFPGEKGDIFYGMMVDRCKERLQPSEFFQNLKFDWSRATRGLLADARKNPDDAAKVLRASGWYLYYHLANRQKQFQSYEKDFKPILAAYNKLRETHGWNVYMHPREGQKIVED